MNYNINKLIVSINIWVWFWRGKICSSIKYMQNSSIIIIFNYYQFLETILIF